MASVCYSLVQFEDAHLCSHDLVFILIAFRLGVDDLLVLDPLALWLLGTHSRFLLYCYQGLGLEVVLLGVEDAWLDDGSSLVVLLELKSLLIGVGLEDTLNDPILRDVSEGPTNHIRIDDPFLFLGVIVGTGALFAPLGVTLDGLVVGWVVLLFLPAVAHVAVGAYLAPAGVVVDVILGLPVYAGLNGEGSTIGS